MGTCLTDRALIRLSGDDPRGFLQGLVTNDVTGELPVWTGLLSPQGKVLFDFLVWADGDDLLVEITSYAAPCATIAGSFVEGAFKRIAQKLHPGTSRLYARVVVAGRVRVGDPVELVRVETPFSALT